MHATSPIRGRSSGGRLRLPRDWAAEQTDTPAEIINHELAHLEGSATIRAGGGETVADPIMATDPDGDPVFHSLARAGDSRDYAFFDISTSTGALEGVCKVLNLY